jgi:hypothetical protein
MLTRTMLHRINRPLLAIVSAALIPQAAHAFSKSGTTYTTSGAQSDVAAAIADASAGDTVTIPAGTFTWGATNSNVPVNKAITLKGAGTGSTTIALASTGPTYGNGVISVSAAATIKDFAVTGTSAPVTAFACNTANGWRVTNIKYTGGTGDAYFLYAGTYGLIDNCNLTGNSGSAELIFSRGPTDSWQTASSMGTANAVYVEDCTFNNVGYVCDANSNARMVIRFCTMNGSNKVDGHGKFSNTPPRGVRHMEVYNNTWTSNGYWTAMELRGGTGFVFNNSNTAGSSTWLILVDYYIINAGYGAGNYPIDDQIGVGKDPKSAHSEPFYLWNNRTPGGVNWTALRSVYNYSIAGVIDPNRDYFEEVSNFTGSAGVGKGTKAQMTSLSPSKAGVGYWVTDEGSWKSGASGSSGQFYVWNGSSWNLKYTPFTYPHPLRNGTTTAPTTTAPTSATTSIQVK